MTKLSTPPSSEKEFVLDAGKLYIREIEDHSRTTMIRRFRELIFNDPKDGNWLDTTLLEANEYYDSTGHQPDISISFRKKIEGHRMKVSENGPNTIRKREATDEEIKEILGFTLEEGLLTREQFFDKLIEETNLDMEATLRLIELCKDAWEMEYHI